MLCLLQLHPYYLRGITLKSKLPRIDLDRTGIFIARLLKQFDWLAFA